MYTSDCCPYILIEFDCFISQFVSGRLSLRMRQPGGLWREVWSVAGPVPAHRQKKLFDDTREAEKVLHYLAGLKTAELGLLVLPILTHCAVHTLRERHGTHTYIQHVLCTGHVTFSQSEYTFNVYGVLLM